MKKHLNIFLCLMASILVSSCAGQTSVIKSMENVRKSILKIETWGRIVNCDESSPGCENYNLLSTGTGSVVLHTNKKVVLTAAHICAQNSGNQRFGEKLEYYFKAIDRKDKEYIIEIIKFDIKSDICVLQSVSGELEPNYLKMSMKSPEYAENAYNLAAPMGIINKNMVPIFQGQYFGKSGGDAFYSLPAIGGSSGSPIVNLKGELIGMVHSVHYRFHHLTLSATYERLWNFLNVERTHIIQCQSKCQHLSF